MSENEEQREETDDTADESKAPTPPEEDASPHEESGDRRVWKFEYEKALEYIESGNVAEARRLLDRLAEEAPFEEIRANAREKRKQFKPDWMAYAFFGGSLLVLLLIIAHYYF